MSFTVVVRVDADPGGLRAVLEGPTGPVWRDLHQRGNRVLSRARTLVPVDQGTLRASLAMEHVTVDGAPAVRIGSNLAYAIYVHEGTGVYAGRGPIRPKSGKYLVWPRKNNAYPTTGGSRRYKGGKTAKYVFAREVRGMRGTPYLLNALPAAG